MSLTYADVLTQITTHATAAAAALTNPILDVAVGSPVPSGRCVRIYYAGEVEPEHMGAGHTLTSRMVAESIALTLFLPMSSDGLQAAAATETEMYDFKHELRTRVLGDSQLGGQSTDLEMALVEPDFVVIGNTRYRILSTTFNTDYAEYTIAP